VGNLTYGAKGWLVRLSTIFSPNERFRTRPTTAGGPRVLETATALCRAAIHRVEGKSTVTLFRLTRRQVAVGAPPRLVTIREAQLRFASALSAVEGLSALRLFSQPASIVRHGSVLAGQFGNVIALRLNTRKPHQYSLAGLTEGLG
jgi:hypothetical protein